MSRTMELHSNLRLDLTKARESNKIFKPVIDKFSAWYIKNAPRMAKAEREECQYVLDHIDPKGKNNAWKRPSDHPLFLVYITYYERDIFYSSYYLLRLIYVDFRQRLLDAKEQAHGPLDSDVPRDVTATFKNGALARFICERYSPKYKIDKDIILEGSQWYGPPPPRPTGWGIVGTKFRRISTQHEMIQSDIIVPMPSEAPDADYLPDSSAPQPEEDSDGSEGYQLKAHVRDYERRLEASRRDLEEHNKKRAHSGSDETMEGFGVPYVPVQPVKKKTRPSLEDGAARDLGTHPEMEQSRKTTTKSHHGLEHSTRKTADPRRDSHQSTKRTTESESEKVIEDLQKRVYDLEKTQEKLIKYLEGIAGAMRPSRR